jgi:hypothetical protein
MVVSLLWLSVYYGCQFTMVVSLLWLLVYYGCRLKLIVHRMKKSNTIKTFLCRLDVFHACVASGEAVEAQ